MPTINADEHPLLSGMHKADLTLGPNRRDKRSVVAVSREDEYRRLYGTIEGVLDRLRLKPAEHFDAGALP